MLLRLGGTGFSVQSSLVNPLAKSMGVKRVADCNSSQVAETCYAKVLCRRASVSLAPVAHGMFFPSWLKRVPEQEQNLPVGSQRCYQLKYILDHQLCSSRAVAWGEPGVSKQFMVSNFLLTFMVPGSVQKQVATFQKAYACFVASCGVRLHSSNAVRVLSSFSVS